LSCAGGADGFNGADNRPEPGAVVGEEGKAADGDIDDSGVECLLFRRRVE
jgi:hypothetical protein